MNDRALPVYVTDTHSLYWYRQRSGLLSPAADAAFRLAEIGGAYIIVPAIVVAELFYLSQKEGTPILPSTLLADIARSREFIFSELGAAQLEGMEEISGVPEMHDRLIAAEALVYRAPIISRDRLLGQSGVVAVIW